MLFIIYIVLGAMFVFNPQAMQVRPPQQAPPPAMGWAFMAIGSVPLLLGWIAAVGTVVAGRFLARRKHYMFCLVMAAITSLFVPFGSILGILTIIVLLRPTVKPLFDQPAV